MSLRRSSRGSKAATSVYVPTATFSSQRSPVQPADKTAKAKTKKPPQQKRTSPSSKENDAATNVASSSSPSPAAVKQRAKAAPAKAIGTDKKSKKAAAPPPQQQKKAATTKSKAQAPPKRARRKSAFDSDSEDKEDDDEAGKDDDGDEVDEGDESDAAEADDKVASDQEEAAEESDTEGTAGPKCQRLFRDFMRRSIAERVVSSWLRRFDANEIVAMEEMAAFMLYSCVGFDDQYNDAIEGVRGCLDDGVEDVIENMNSITEAAVFYPLVCSAKAGSKWAKDSSNPFKQYKAFPARLVAFWKALAAAMGARDTTTTTTSGSGGSPAKTDNSSSSGGGGGGGGDHLDVVAQCLSWLTAISSAKNRALRHTATFCAFALAQARARQCEAVLRRLDVNQKRLQAERQGAAGDKKARRLPSRSVGRAFVSA